MEQQLLDRALASGLNVYQNTLGRWVIKGSIEKKMWILQEQSTNSWLMSFDEFSQVSLCTKRSLEALNLFIKHSY